MESRVKLQNVLNVSNQYPQCETHVELLDDLSGKKSDKEANVTHKIMNESKTFYFLTILCHNKSKLRILL